jgi:hypothetical protein
LTNTKNFPTPQLTAFSGVFNAGQGCNDFIKLKTQKGKNHEAHQIGIRIKRCD